MEMGREDTYSLLVGVKSSAASWKSVQRILKKLEIDLPHDQDTLLSRDAFSSMFIDVLVTMPGMWKQNICPLTGEWIMRMWYIYM